MKEYDGFYWAVAWATVGFDAYKTLKTHSRKAKRIVVGTHFYQTHPAFIEQFSRNKAFRYFYDTASIAGVFHPKVFLFQRSGGEMAAIVGSANFTRSALNKNQEICLLITDRDDSSGSLLTALKKQIEDLWRDADPFPLTALPAYTDRWKRKWASADADHFGTKKPRSLLHVAFLNLSWVKIYKQMQTDTRFRRRLEMLRRIRSFFHPVVRFSDLELDERRKVAGTFRDEPATQWKLFGSMQGAIDFKERLRANRAEISDALDCIPWESAVSRTHFEQFKESLRLAFNYSRPFNGVAVASRLLAMKRPDYFLCVDKANRKQLALRLGVPASRFTLDSYWDLIEQLIDTPWWNSAEPANQTARETWLARVAMLDALFYER